jgi:hypothetical protein
MAEVGPPETDARWVYQYRRCRQCDFAVRVILREIPDAALATNLRESLARSFMGWDPSGTVSSSSRGAPTKPDHTTGQTMGVPTRTHTGGVL